MAPIVRNETGSQEPEPGRSRERRWFLLLWVAPVMLLLLGVVLPLISGANTLYLRDVLNTHYPMKWTQAQAMRDGRLPMVDIQRGGGQAHLGNPNTVPLYPDNLLFLVAEPLWTVNAHFWIHWLIAPFAAYWLGRRLGMRREAAWAMGVLYATSGFFMATLNLYNMIAPMALLPALLAAALQLARPERRPWTFLAGSALWALLILAGEPMTAAFALIATVVIVAICHGRRYPWLAATASVALGTGLAAPQCIEFLRILSFTYRGHWGYIHSAASLGGWAPHDVADLLIPFFYGLPNNNYWGQSLHADTLPLFLTYYPGILMIALMVAARGDGRRTLLWAWALVGVSLFLALGEWNPIIVALSKMPGASLLRIPSKLWSLVTLGSAVLCGLAFDRLFTAEGRRRVARPLLTLAGLYLVAWVVMTVWPQSVESWAGPMFPERATPSAVSSERLRWAGVCFLSVALIGFYLLCLKVGARRVRLATLALLVVHAASQLFILRPLVDQDERRLYSETPALPSELPAGARVAHGTDMNLFGLSPRPVRPYPDARPFWRQRQLHTDLMPAFGKLGGLRYELNLSPEGLDSFLTRVMVQLMWNFDDTQRLRVLESSAVEYLLINRDVEETVADRVELVVSTPSIHDDLRVYRVVNAAPPLQVLGRVRGSDNFNEGLDLLMSDDFDHLSSVVLAGEHEPWEGESGSARLIRETAESIEIEVTAPNQAVLVVHRTHLPIYRATIDDEPAPLHAANMHHTAVKVPAGTHTVRIDVDRGSLRWGVTVTLACALILAWILWRGLPGFLEPTGSPAAAPPAP